MPGVASYTMEDVKTAFQRSITHQSLAVQLGISTSAAKRAITKYRSHLVISDWITFGERGCPIPRYVWKRHNWEKDREYPQMPRTWAEKCDSANEKIMAKLRHEMLIDMLFAKDIGEILKAQVEYVHRVRSLGKHQRASDSKRPKRKTKKVGLRLVDGELKEVRVPIGEESKKPTPVNQDVFWFAKTA